MNRVQTQSTKLSSSMYLPEISRGRRPVMSSKSMTPNEKTSDLSVSFPLDAYSGAIYLHFMVKKTFSVTFTLEMSLFDLSK